MLTRKLFGGGGGVLPDLQSLGLTKSYTAGVTSKTFVVLVGVVDPSKDFTSREKLIFGPILFYHWQHNTQFCTLH